jgi:hypothetical protein
VDGGLVADGEFVVSGGHGPVLFEVVDTAFDGVTRRRLSANFAGSGRPVVGVGRGCGALLARQLRYVAGRTAG